MFRLTREFIFLTFSPKYKLQKENSSLLNTSITEKRKLEFYYNKLILCVVSLTYSVEKNRITLTQTEKNQVIKEYLFVFFLSQNYLSKRGKSLGSTKIFTNNLLLTKLAPIHTQRPLSMLGSTLLIICQFCAATMQSNCRPNKSCPQNAVFCNTDERERKLL